MNDTALITTGDGYRLAHRLDGNGTKPMRVLSIGIVDALYRFGASQDPGDRHVFESAFSVDTPLDLAEPAECLGAACMHLDVGFATNATVTP